MLASETGPVVETGRREDHRFITGRGRYVENLPADGALVAHVVRSPVANGRIRRLDVTAAKAAPGIAAVLTGEDLLAAGVGPLPCILPVTSADGSAMIEPPRHALVSGHVRFVGDPVALIVGESMDACLDAAELVELDIETLPAVVDLRTAVEPAAPVIWPEAAGNIAFDWQTGDRAAVDAALARAAHVVTLDLVNSRVAVSPLETRSLVARWDAAAERFEILTCSQGVHEQQGVFATIFGLPPDRIHVVTPDLGGGFGMKIMVYPEQVACMAAARLLGRPVRWSATRGESFVSDHHGRDQACTATLALDADGRFLALAVDTLANMGGYVAMTAPMMPTVVFTMVLGGCYTIPAVHVRARGVFTNMPCTDAYRGAGVPESLYLLERIVDLAALRTGIDRVEIRRRNLIPASVMPYTTAIGRRYDVGDFTATLDAALASAGWDGFAGRRAASMARGRRRGIGLACYIHCTSGYTADASRVRVEPDGGVVVIAGSVSSGQGHETVFARFVADRLGIDASRVRVVEGDSDLLPRSAGSGGSSGMVVAAGSVLAATEVMLEAARDFAARRLECDRGDLVYGEGAYRVAGTDVSVTLGALAGWAAGLVDLPEEKRRDPICGLGHFSGESNTFPYGTYVCEVEVEPDTGRVTVVAFTAVDDLGRVLDATIVAGQVHGGITQGIGQALHERVVYDQCNGQLLTGSFMDYGLPRADDLPFFAWERRDIPSTNNPLGMKGVGECGTIGAPAAVINAICDALAIEHLDMPATPERVWRAAVDAGLA